MCVRVCVYFRVRVSLSIAHIDSLAHTHAGLLCHPCLQWDLVTEPALSPNTKLILPRFRLPVRSKKPNISEKEISLDYYSILGSNVS